MSTAYRFVQAVDTLSIRGNKLFGDAGSHGDCHFPPRPSVLSGAFRSVLWANNGHDVDAILNSAFSIASVFPARGNSQGKLEIYLPLPADVVVTDEGKILRQLEPQAIDKRIFHSQISQLPMLPVLRQGKPSKAESGWLLNQTGINTYLQGHSLTTAHVIRQSELWANESRIGIGLNRSSRTADEGKLFTVEHTAMMQKEHWQHCENKTPANNTVGLLVGIDGCNELPDEGFIRLGGDGRAAQYSSIAAPDIQQPSVKDKFKLVLLTPGLFNDGWLPDGVIEASGELWLKGDGFRAHLCCAAISRAEVVSGWDLVQWQPKTAERVAPAGSVYWFDQFEGNANKLAGWVAAGIWFDNNKSQRRAEGFNRAWLALWT